MSEKKRALPLKEYVGYGSCEISSNTLYTVISTFLLMFYTDYIGVSAAAAGMVILVSKVLDGISDLIIGAILDRTHTKNGSVRPWVFRMAIPMLLAWIMLFAVPPVGDIGKIVYIFITYNLVNTVIYTFVSCGFTALPTYMTDDVQARSTLYVIKMIVACTVQTLTCMVFMKVVIAFGDDQKAWLLTAAILGTVAMLIQFFVYFTTKERVVPSTGKEDDIPVWESVKIVLTNKYWLLLLGSQMTITLIQVAILTVGSYYAKYVMNDVTLQGNLVMFFGIPGIFLMMIVPKLIAKIGKRNVAILGAIIMLIGQIISIVNIDLMYISLVVRGIGFSFAMSTLNGMLADTIEYSEWKTGHRPQSMTMAASTISQKVASGLGNALLGIYLTASGFDIDPTCATSIAAIKNVFVIVPVIVLVAMVLLYLVYDLDKKYDSIVSDIKARKANATK